VLFSPAEHESPAVTWDEARVRASVREIVADAEQAFDEGSWWPVHPRDGDYTGIDVYTTHGLWSGAAGVLWALHRLAEVGAVTLSRDYATAAARLHEDYLLHAGGDAPAVPSLWVGEAGILLVAETIAPDPERAGRLLDVVRSNAANETNEVMWGSPGTMIAARAMLERTGDERWSEAWRASADRLWQEWVRSEELGCRLWTQQLYGKVSRYVGAGHGFASSVLALSQLVPDDRREELTERATEAVRVLAVSEDGLANWPPLADGPLEIPKQGIRVQWCHGAPGIVTSLAGLPAVPELDELLVAGGELTWAAGPLAKGPGLCHGTAGNGFALLALYGRTGDSFWLERARAFAMHALGQVERERAEHGRGRHSLFTGDVGAALFAWQCIDGDPRFPTIDVW
jgi:hypothetical protein